MSEIDILDMGKIQAEVEKIKKKIAEREKEIEQIDTDMEKLEERKGKLEKIKKEEVYQKFGALEKEFTFAKDIRNKMDAFGKAMSRAQKSQKDIIALYKKAFNRLSTDKVTIPQEAFHFEHDYHGSYLTLYSRGFGRSYGEDYTSRYIDGWEQLKEIFNSPDIADYIIKNDKRDIFYAFSDAVSNWIELKDEYDPYSSSKAVISVRTKAPYIAIKESYGDEVTVKSTEVNRITVEKTRAWSHERGDYMTYKVSFETTNDRYGKELEELGFGEFYALAHAWKDLEGQLDEQINQYNSIAENNETVLKQLKQAVAIHMVVDEL